MVFVSRPLSLSHRLHTSLFPRSSVVDMKERRRFEDSDGIIQLGVVICEDLSAANRGELLAAACDFGLRLFMPSYVEDSNSLNHVLDESTTSPSSAETVSHRFWLLVVYMEGIPTSLRSINSREVLTL